MQVFEYYFNPKAQKDRFFEVSSMEPRLRPSLLARDYGGQAEKDPSRGNLYIIGELEHTLPQNSGLLQKFAKVVSREYSSPTAVKTQDAFFHALVKGANDFFAQELKRGNSDWLGNLHIALLYIKNSGKRSSVVFTRCGGMKVFMTRGTNVVDLTKNLHDSSHGTELFASSVSLHAFAQDKIVVLTRDVYNALNKENALSDLSAPARAQQFQVFFKEREKAFSRLSGILFAVLTEEFVSQTPPLSFLKKSMFSMHLPRIRVPFARLLRFPVFKIKAPSLMLSDTKKQKIVMLVAFFALLAGGFLAFQGEKQELQRQVQTIVLQIQVIQKEGRDALELDDRRSANILLQEAWKKASSHTGREIPFRETFLALQEELEQQLLSINSIQYVENPTTIVDIKQENIELIPQNMLLAQGNLYLFNPFSPQIFIFDLQEEKGKVVSDPSIRKPDARTAEFNKNVYVLNPQEGTIAKNKEPWMSEGSMKKPMGAKSIAVDGNIWILSQENILQRYFGGLWQEDITPLIFPLLKNASMIKAFPELPYLYVLDPSESRVILLSKSGDLVRQYFLDAQGSLLDFTLSRNGNTLYLLAGSRVFAIEVE
ncbi:MAG: hypothetical protein HYU04_01930 [Candidatus Wildermuthbacteria bacterium]|nr:hypothetical protein [Candidatus Wildermuthbacteria bacterium]